MKLEMILGKHTGLKEELEEAGAQAWCVGLTHNTTSTVSNSACLHSAHGLSVFGKENADYQIQNASEELFLCHSFYSFCNTHSLCLSQATSYLLALCFHCVSVWSTIYTHLWFLLCLLSFNFLFSLYP